MSTIAEFPAGHTNRLRRKSFLHLFKPDPDRLMALIEISRKDSKTFVVTVNASIITTHTVTLEPEYYDKLTGGKVTAEILIEKSFEFLLERESNTSILSSFDLPLINRYFPEYENSIGQRL